MPISAYRTTTAAFVLLILSAATMLFLTMHEVAATLPEYKEYLQGIATPTVQQVMTSVDRKYYSRSPTPYALCPLQIHLDGDGPVNMSAPSVHALALDLAYKHCPSAKNVLDFGSGSGYLTVCFAHLYPEAAIYGLERITRLVEVSRENVRNDPAAQSVLGRVSFMARNGLSASDLADLPEMDVIHMGAAHVGIPQAVAAKLATGGILIFPEDTLGGWADQRFVVYRKEAGGQLEKIDDVGSVVYITARDSPPS